MTNVEDRIVADYRVTPSGLGELLEAMVRIQRPVMVWGPPGVGKSDVAKEVASQLGYQYVDIRALLLDPVDLRGIPWRDIILSDGTYANGKIASELDVDASELQYVTRWASPVFLPPSNSEENYLINLEELPSATPMVQAALYQLVLDRACGEYRLPVGASIIACGNREGDRAVAHQMSTALASRFIHIEITVDNDDWTRWALNHDIVDQVIFFLRFRPILLHQFDPRSKEPAFPCPRTWSFVSDIFKGNASLSFASEQALYRGAVGQAAAVEFTAFLEIWRELPDYQTILDDPKNAIVPDNPSALLSLCGALCGHANEDNMDSITAYAQRLVPEVGEFLISSCIERNKELQYTRAWVNWVSEHN